MGYQSKNKNSGKSSLKDLIMKKDSNKSLKKKGKQKNSKKLKNMNTKDILSIIKSSKSKNK